jgi:hypothetical protein
VDFLVAVDGRTVLFMLGLGPCLTAEYRWIIGFV